MDAGDLAVLLGGDADHPALSRPDALSPAMLQAIRDKL
jgi:hypothetical protein